MKEKSCEVCGKRPARGLFRVLCDRCRTELRKKLEEYRRIKRGKRK